MHCIHMRDAFDGGRVFTGDVCTLVYDGGITNYAMVRYNNQKYCYELKTNEDSIKINDCMHIVVVGNIYQHPELKELFDFEM